MGKVCVEVGHRIEYKQARGYVRYIGELPGKEKIWIGIDWDDAARGLHDGTYCDVSYFSTHAATSGSFAPASKVGNGGRTSIVDAILHRVAAFDDSVARPQESHQLRIMNAIDVSGMGVTSPLVFSQQEIGVDCKSILYFYIAQVLLTDFADVHNILDQMVSLRTLDLSRNIFDTFPSAKSLVRPHNLRRLDMNGCNVKLAALYDVCARCPELSELRLFNNGFTSLMMDGLELSDVIQSVQIIDLGGNRIPFAEICRVLGVLPKLEELFLIDNGIDGSEGVESDGLFPALERLSVSDSPLQKWRLFSSLHRLPFLTSLLATNTPLTEDESKLDEIEMDDDTLLSRHAIIGRLPKLKKLHGSEIDGDERMYSEKRYLLVECIPALRTSPILGDVEKVHPRIVELASTFGVDLETNVGNHANGDSSKPILEHTLRRDLVSVQIQGNGKTHNRLLPLSIDTAKLRAITRRILGVSSGQPFKLCLLFEDTPILLENDHVRRRSLADLNVKRDDQVLVKLVAKGVEE